MHRGLPIPLTSKMNSPSIWQISHHCCTSHQQADASKRQGYPADRGKLHASKARPYSLSSLSLLIMLNRVPGAWRAVAAWDQATSTIPAGRCLQQCSPEGQEEAVADEHAQSPEHSEAQADIVEVVVGPAEQVPGLQLFS